MIEEAYVSFETAKLLKEKGFDEKCSYVWILDKANNPEDTDSVYKVSSPHFMEGESYVTNEDIDKVLEHSDEYYHKDVFICPTQQMVMRWLREIHNIHIDIYSIYDTNRWLYQVFVITPRTACNSYVDKILYTSYEQAIEAAIYYSLKNLI